MTNKIETARGFSPAWDDEYFGSYTTVLVRSPCREVSEAFLELKSSNDLQLATDWRTGVHEEARGNAIFLYQLRGHSWTQLFGHQLFHDHGEDLSRSLETLAFVHAFEDTGGCTYQALFDRGEEVETLVSNPYAYDQTEEEQEEERQALLAEGRQVSADNFHSFLSKRGTAIDFQAEDVWSQLPQRLDLYVDFADLVTDSERGVLVPGWTEENLEAMSLLRPADQGADQGASLP